MLSLPRGPKPLPPRVQTDAMSSPVVVVMGGKDDEEFSDEDIDLDDIYVRTKFLESWLWTEVDLPGAPGEDG